MDNFILSLALLFLITPNPSDEKLIIDNEVPLSNEPTSISSEPLGLKISNIAGRFEFSDRLDSYKLIKQVEKFRIYKSQNSQKLRVEYSGTQGIGAVTVANGDNQKVFNCTGEDMISLNTGVNTIKLCEREVKDSAKVRIVDQFDITKEQDSSTHLGNTYNADNSACLVTNIGEISQGLWDKSTSIDMYIRYCYNYACNIRYDHDKASDIKSGRIKYKKANIEDTVLNQQGICLDKASLLADMLRLKGIEAKVVFGYISKYEGYHAWVESYSPSKGWIILDPTIKVYGANEDYVRDRNYIE